MSKRPLLDYIPDPLLSDLVAGRWLPIVGAGLSRNARLPQGMPPLPDWSELGASISKELPAEHSGDSPIEVLSAYEHAFGRARLVMRVSEALHVGEAIPGPVHESFTALPFDSVVTTNVEQLLEASYRARYGAVLAVTEEEQLRLSNPYGGPTIVKLHGDLHHPSSLTLTEEDYDTFAIRRPLFITWLAHQLIVKTGVLVGYSLDDADFRQILALLRSRLGQVPPDLYVIGVGLSSAREARYRRRGVRVVNLPKTLRGHEILVDLFSQLHQHWQTNFSSTLTGTTASVRALLRAGQRVDSAMLFLVPDEMLSAYDEFVFPDLLKQGLVPFTRQDIAHPTNYRVASYDALFAIAGVVVVHTSLRDDPLVQRATSAVGASRVVIVGTSGTPVGRDIPLEPTGDWEAFGHALVEILLRQREQLVETPPELDAIETLYRTGSYRGAALLSLIELERRVRLLLGPSTTAHARTVGFHQVIELARVQFDLPIDAVTLRKLVNTRNALVHGSDQLPEPELSEIAEVTRNLLAHLPNP